MKHKFVFLSFCLLGMAGYGCGKESKQETEISSYSNLILDNIFLSEDFSLPPYYELKLKGGGMYRVDSIFDSQKLVVRFTELDCEKCYLEEFKRIDASGLTPYTIGIASFRNMRALELLKRKFNIQFPVYYLPFVDEKDLLPESLNNLGKPYVFLMDERCKSQYLFLPSLHHSNVSFDYYRKVYSLLVKENKNNIDVFEEKSVFLGKVTLGKSYKAIFKYKNKSDGYLIIENVNVSCGCTIPHLENKLLLKGDSAELCVTFTPNSVGYNSKVLMVQHNKSQYPVKLFIKAEVVGR